MTKDDIRDNDNDPDYLTPEELIGVKESLEDYKAGRYEVVKPSEIEKHLLEDDS